MNSYLVSSPGSWTDSQFVWPSDSTIPVSVMLREEYIQRTGRNKTGVTDTPCDALHCIHCGVRTDYRRRRGEKIKYNHVNKMFNLNDSTTTVVALFVTQYMGIT